MTPEKIAEICHEASRAICLAADDHSQLPWNLAPDWQKISVLHGVNAALANDATSVKENHETWRQHKIAEGWRYGTVKDPEAKLHPCLVPYEELPFEQRVKNYVFMALVNTLARE